MSYKIDEIEGIGPSFAEKLGKAGIAFAGRGYQAQTEFLFTGLNRIKPDMIQEATRNAREVAAKFAKDSQSRLGKIKQARHGQFSINDRDSNFPAQCIIFFRESADQFLDCECLAILGGVLSRRLIAAAA